jgi:hypothetical protein
MLLKDSEHAHHQENEVALTEADHAEAEEAHPAESSPADADDHADHAHAAFSPLELDFWLSTEFLGGLLALIFFVWIWHRKPFKRFVPCSHDHCHHKTIWPHLLASVAFVFHWFPESRLRYDLLNSFSVHNFSDVLTALGFLSHFLVDIIVLVLLLTYWPKAWQKSLAFGIMLWFWVISFWVGEQGGLYLTGLSEPLILLFSAFLLAMFVHQPHKPAPECKTCDH